ncbi:hypothetical protein [Mycolicibacterium pallens]|uniref:Uncharacterized protein n=1 Tax=Mycolicibacterium pallens TaxID=370524 RepID=A0ABX8VCS9_9MYCO|nr:hypothetical protein [Mycolicibacterium pallens]QYL15583.1 hypothetical protein K0O64_21140 [Mycolicibacterium pallens]
MGVDLMLLYEYSNRQVGHNKYSDSDLMGETFRATDPIDARRRATYDLVVAVFRKHHDQLIRNPGTASSVARRYFGGDAGGTVRSSSLVSFCRQARLLRAERTDHAGRRRGLHRGASVVRGLHANDYR